MSWQRGCGRQGVACGVLICFLASVASAEPTIVQPSDVISAPGLYLTEPDATKLTELLRDADAAKAIVETQQAALAARDRQIAELLEQVKQLQTAARAQEIALAKAEERDRIRAEIDAKQEMMLKQLVEVLKEERRQRSIERVLSLVPIIGAALILLGFGGLGR